MPVMTPTGYLVLKANCPTASLIRTSSAPIRPACTVPVPPVFRILPARCPDIKATDESGPVTAVVPAQRITAL